MKRFLKLTLLSLLILLLLAASGFVLWAETPASPGPLALAALESDEFVDVFQREDHIVFYPAICEAQIAEENAAGQQHLIKGFIFYPGGRVDYRAYAPVLRKIAEQGVIVFLVRVRLNLAFFDIEAGAPLLEKTEGVDLWAAGGHSLGGVAASLFAQNHPEVRGVVFWASYPADERFRAAKPPNSSPSRAATMPNLVITAFRTAITRPPSPPNVSGNKLPRRRWNSCNHSIYKSSNQKIS